MLPSVDTLLARTLFWISCLLGLVSFYTTREGMALYLSPWFSWAAAAGVQLALVMVAWLFGTSAAEGERLRRRRGLLLGVYALTAAVSISFSYVSLNTWFSARERPVQQQRKLYDELTAAAARAETQLADAVANGRRYTAALDEMAVAEKQHGFISRARDAEPYLDAIREAVAREAQSTGRAYQEGSGEGLRYTAFSRHAELTRLGTAAMESAQQTLARAKAELRPDMPVENQLRQFHQAYDPIAWDTVARMLGKPAAARETIPTYAEFAERSGSGQEDLLRSFEELFGAPTGRNLFSLALAAFIDIIIFLLALAAGPYLRGEQNGRWEAAGATLDSHDRQVFARNLLQKVRAGRQGMARLNADDLTAGELQWCLLLTGHGQAVLHQSETEGDYYLLEPATHQRLAEAIGKPSLALRAASAATAR